MNDKRSYLDSLNAGRPRKAHASLEDLNRSLDALASRLERGNDGARGRVDDFTRRQQWASEPRLRTGTDDGRRAEWPRQNDFSYQSIARDIDRVRGQEEGVASVGRIAGELKGLKLTGTFPPDPKQPNQRIRSRDVTLTLNVQTGKK